MKNRFFLGILGLAFLTALFICGCGNKTVTEISDVTENENKKLTLLVYMAADNDLECYALQNIKAMERAEFNNLNILVLMDRSEGYDETDGNWTDTRLFQVMHDPTDGSFIVSRRLDCAPLGLSAVEKTELDMSNPVVLSSFIQYAKKEFKSEQYILVMWGHGTGWRYSADNNSSRAVALDDKSGSYMSISQMGKALQNQGLSVIGFDTCFGGVFENVYELKDAASYTVASPGITPSAGWDYTRLITALDSCDFSSLSVALCMAQSCSAGITVFDNSKLTESMNAIDTFAQNLAKTVTDMSSRAQVFDQMMQLKSYVAAQYPCDRYLDIPSMAEFYSKSTDQLVAQSAAQLKEKMSALTVSYGTAECKGVGIHFIPMTAPSVAAACHSKDYIKDSVLSDQCAFIKESLWWVPSRDLETESLLNRLFYTSY